MEKSKVYEILNELKILFPNAHCELDYKNIYQLLVMVLLSAQTKDSSVNNISSVLFEKYPSFYELSKANDELEQIIKPLGLSKSKSKNLIELSKIIISRYDGEIPKDLESLIQLPGIGRKSASVILCEGYKIPAFPVDTHVERVSKRMGIVPIDYSVIQTEELLKQTIEKNDWHMSHHLFLFMGRYHCFSKKPLCDKCFYKEACIYNKTKI